MANLDLAGVITRMCTDLKEKFASKSVETSKQDKLVSGTNIKTVNGTSLLGSGNVGVQPTLVSGTNIKTVNGTSLLGSGNISVSGGSDTVETIYDNASWTILKYGHVIMVQCHGYSGTATTSAAKLAGVLADYKPAYNISTPVLTSSGGSTQAARMVVYASDGGVYIVPAGYSSSASWYGTLTYIY